MNLSGLIAQLQAVQAEHGDGRVTLAEVSFMEGTHQLVRLLYVGRDGQRQATDGDVVHARRIPDEALEHAQNIAQASTLSLEEIRQLRRDKRKQKREEERRDREIWEQAVAWQKSQGGVQ